MFRGVEVAEAYGVFSVRAPSRSSTRVQLYSLITSASGTQSWWVVVANKVVTEMAYPGHVLKSLLAKESLQRLVAVASDDNVGGREEFTGSSSSSSPPLSKVGTWFELVHAKKAHSNLGDELVTVKEWAEGTSVLLRFESDTGVTGWSSQRYLGGEIVSWPAHQPQQRTKNKEKIVGVATLNQKISEGGIPVHFSPMVI